MLIDVDAGTSLGEELTHAHGATPRQPRLREHRYAALLAHACNLGYARMGQAARIDPQQHINPLGTYTFDTGRPAGQLLPLRAPQVAA